MTLLLRPRAVLFDLDDTLITSNDSPRAAWATVVATFAARLDGRPVDGIAGAIDVAAHWYWSDPVRHKAGRLDLAAARRQIVGRGLAAFSLSSADLIAEIVDGYTAYRDAGTRLFDGAHDVLIELRSRGLRLGLITNGAAEMQRAKIDRFELADRFDHIQIEGELGIGKPEPEAYAHALKGLGTVAAETWIVGDNLDWEVAAPKRLGFTTV
jgi:putative hydrolase of the HAD superfamily